MYSITAGGVFQHSREPRGVLRLLSLVVHSLKETNKPYISLADFDLANQEIRQELLKHIGAEFNSVIAADISDMEAGSKWNSLEREAVEVLFKYGSFISLKIISPNEYSAMKEMDFPFIL